MSAKDGQSYALMASLDLAGVERFKFCLTTVPCAFRAGFSALLSFFSSFFIFPFSCFFFSSWPHANPLLYSGAGSWPPSRTGTKSHPFPSWEIFPEGERAQIVFRSSPDFSGYLPETPNVVSKRSLIFYDGVKFHLFWIFTPLSKSSVKHSAQHLICLIHWISDMARVFSQHTLLDDADRPRQFLHFLALLLQELKHVLPSLRSRRSTQVHFSHVRILKTHKTCYQRIVRRGAVRNSWERVYPRNEVLRQFPEAQPPLSWSRNTWTDRTRSKQYRLRHLCSIRTTWSRSRRGWPLIPHGTPHRQS